MVKPGCHDTKYSTKAQYSAKNYYTRRRFSIAWGQTGPKASATRSRKQSYGEDTRRGHLPAPRER